MRLSTKCCDSEDYEAVLEFVPLLNARMCKGYRCLACGKISSNIKGEM